MKKLIFFLTLVLSVSFVEISAQTHTIRWEVYQNSNLQIKVNGVNVLPTVSVPINSFFVSGVLN